MILRFPDKNKYRQEHVLDRIPAERIYSYYLGEHINDSKAYKCCFHKDKTPSLKFKRLHNNILWFNCFGCGACGDAFQFVANLHNITYKEAIHHVVDTLEGKDSEYIKQVKFIEYKESNTKIFPYFKKYNSTDLQYWKDFGIRPNTLDYFNVKVCDRVFIFSGKSEFEAKYNVSNPLFCYVQGKDSYKIYRPLNPTKSGKFMGNVNAFDIQGIQQLPKKGDKLIITSSLKDVMVLYETGFHAVAPQGEGIDIPPKIVDYLYACFPEIYVLFDSDEAGYKYTNKIVNKYNFIPIFIPESYGVKDISDFSKKYGLNETKSLVEKLVNG